MNTLEELFQGTLKEVYYAEKQLTKALPKMAKKATSEQLAEVFRTHLEQTQGHIERLERDSSSLALRPRARNATPSTASSRKPKG